MAVFLMGVNVSLRTRIVHQVGLGLHLSGARDQDVIVRQKPSDAGGIVSFHRGLEPGVERRDIVAADRTSGGERAAGQSEEGQKQQNS